MEDPFFTATRKYLSGGCTPYYENLMHQYKNPYTLPERKSETYERALKFREREKQQTEVGLWLGGQEDFDDFEESTSPREQVDVPPVQAENEATTGTVGSLEDALTAYALGHLWPIMRDEELDCDTFSQMEYQDLVDLDVPVEDQPAAMELIETLKMVKGDI